MSAHSLIMALMGGALIGLACVLLLLALGRIAGISSLMSGVLAGLMAFNFDSHLRWRLAFLIGLPLGALAVSALGWSEWSHIRMQVGLPLTIVSGLLVGFGTALGTGCTSGHGICGMARFSLRSVVATMIFMAGAAVSVFILRHIIGGAG